MTDFDEVDGFRTQVVPGNGHAAHGHGRQAPVLLVASIRTGRHAVITLTGDLDLSTVDDVRAAAERCLSQRPERLSMDLSGLEFCDCSGVAVLRGVLDDAELAGVEFRLLAPSDWIRRVFTLADAAELLAASSRSPQQPSAHSAGVSDAREP